MSEPPSPRDEPRTLEYHPTEREADSPFRRHIYDFVGGFSGSVLALLLGLTGLAGGDIVAVILSMTPGAALIGYIAHLGFKHGRYAAVVGCATVLGFAGLLWGLCAIR